MSEKYSTPIRRTPEEKLETIELTKSIIERVKSFEITGYELNRHVDMSIPALDNIINGKTKMPSLDILRNIDIYISKFYESKTVDTVAESKQSYGERSGSLKEIMDQLKVIEEKLDKSDFRQEILFEILKNSKAAEISYLEKMEEKATNSVKGSN